MPFKNREQQLQYFKDRNRRLHPQVPLPDGFIPILPGRRVGHVVDAKTGCWEWHGYRHPDGYGSVGIGGRQGRPIPAHRVYYEREYGSIAPGLTIDHLCRNRGCVNPAHLEAVPNAENVRRGERSKLSQEKASEIRGRFAAGGITKRDLAKEFGVHESVIIEVVKGRAWT